MRNRILAGMLGLVMMAALAGCGSNPEAIWYGTVTNTAGTAGNITMTEISSGMETYGQTVERQTKLYTAAEDTTEGFEAQIDTAVEEDEVKVILTAGKEMETAIFNAQNKHKNTKFVLFDGEPRENEDAEANIRKNTTVITFDEYDFGYLAGYAAVREGYRNIGYLTGTENESSRSAYDGFLAGCERAARDAGVSAGEVVIYSEFSGSDELMPLRMTEAMSWYAEGVQLIATDNEIIMTAIAKAAAASDGKTVSIGFEESGVLFATVPNYSGATQAVLAAAEKNDSFNGGTTQVYGFEERAIQIRNGASVFAIFNDTLYNSFLDSVTGGVSSDEETTSLVTVNVKDPATPDANAGLESSSASNEGEVESDIEGAEDSSVSETYTEE